MIYECFYFYNELDLLDLKLHESGQVVDKFVLCEFKTDVRHRPQRLYYNENKERFKEFESKIIHIIGEDDFSNLSGHGLYAARKELYMKGLEGCSPNDIVIASDPDVILKKEALEKLPSYNMDNMEVQFISDWFCYYMDYLYIHCKFGFNGANYYKNIHAGKWATIYRWKPVGALIDDAGYHFSKLGGIDALIENITGYPHQECNIESLKNRENIQYKMDHRLAWDSNLAQNPQPVYNHIPYDPACYPKYVNEHPEIYAKYFRGEMK
jgi:hypothetical protein